MAEKQFNLQSNYGWGLSLNMTGKAPEVAKRIFNTYNDAFAYADDINDSAIEGLTLTVVNDGNKNGVYFVKSTRKPSIIAKLEGNDIKILSGTTTQDTTFSTKTDAETWANSLSSYTDCFNFKDEDKEKVGDFSGRGKICKVGSDYYEVRQIKCDTTELVKLSTAADSVVSADAVQKNLDEAISANNSAHTVFSGAIQDNYSAITAVSSSVSALTENFEKEVKERQENDKYLSGVTSGIVQSLAEYKIKNIQSTTLGAGGNSGHTILSVDENGILSDTIALDYDDKNQKIYLRGVGGTIIDEISTSDFITDGMLNNAEIVTGATGSKLVLTFNTDATDKGQQTIEIPITDFLNGTELGVIKSNLEAHLNSGNTQHFSSSDRTAFDALIQNYSKNQLDAKFSANIEAHSNLSSDIAGVNTKVENILGNNTGYTGVTIPKLHSGITANTEAIEDLENWAVGQVGDLETSIQDIISDINDVTTTNTAAHTTLQSNIDSANTRIDNVITAYTAADNAINGKISELEGKVNENEEVVAEALTDLQANKVSAIAAEEESNIVVNEVKNNDGISYTIGFQWLTF